METLVQLKGSIFKLDTSKLRKDVVKPRIQCESHGRGHPHQSSQALEGFKKLLSRTADTLSPPRAATLLLRFEVAIRPEKHESLAAGAT